MTQLSTTAPAAPLQKLAHDVLERVDRVTLELSNLCNYSKLHAKCPAHAISAPEILPRRIVLDVLDTLGQAGFGEGRYLAFHVYNEPLLDPRFASFVEYARRRCPKLNVILWSNGWYLYEGLALELIQLGVTHFSITAYSDEEHVRFERLASRLKEQLVRPEHVPPLPVYFRTMRMRELDERMSEDFVVLEPTGRPCFQPLSDLTIWASGAIGLCCLDWARSVEFGCVNEEGFEAALVRAAPRLLETYANLTRAQPQLPVCQKCPTPHERANVRAKERWHEGRRISPR
jgi:hypothetical protein